MKNRAFKSKHAYQGKQINQSKKKVYLKNAPK